MAEILAKQYGTEEDQVNCPFYFKIGACRYEQACLRNHIRPPYSQTILIQKMYKNQPVELAIASGNENSVSREDAEKARENFEEFYTEVFRQLASYGEIQDMLVCDNIGDHMIGNVYVKYTLEEDAIKAFEQLKIRYYDGGLLQPEYSPATDFSNAKCQQYIQSSCKYGGYCNYIHLQHISSSVQQKLFSDMYKIHPEYKDKHRKSKNKSSRGGGGGGGGRDSNSDSSKSDSSDSQDQQKRKHKHHKKRRQNSDSSSPEQSKKHGQHGQRGGDHHRGSRRDRQRDQSRGRRGRGSSGEPERRQRSSESFSNSQQRRRAIAAWQNDDNNENQQQN